MELPFVDPEIPSHVPYYEQGALGPPVLAYFLVDLPYMRAELSLPGLKRVFRIAGLCEARKRCAPEPHALERIGKFGTVVDMILFTYEFPEIWSNCVSSCDKPLYLEFENGTVLRLGGGANSHRMGGHTAFRPKAE